MKRDAQRLARLDSTSLYQQVAQIMRGNNSKGVIRTGLKGYQLTVKIHGPYKAFRLNTGNSSTRPKKFTLRLPTLAKRTPFIYSATEKPTHMSPYEPCTHRNNDSLLLVGTRALEDLAGGASMKNFHDHV